MANPVSKSMVIAIAYVTQGKNNMGRGDKNECLAHISDTSVRMVSLPYG
jgi:hypothetical protein